MKSKIFLKSCNFPQPSIILSQKTNERNSSLGARLGTKNTYQDMEKKSIFILIKASKIKQNILNAALFKIQKNIASTLKKNLKAPNVPIGSREKALRMSLDFFPSDVS